MANIVDYIIRIAARGRSEIERLNGDTEDLNENVDKVTAGFSRMFKILGGAAVIAATANYVRKSTEAYNQQAVAETKLTQVMRNTQKATAEHVQSILELTGAQQKLGVVGDEVQLSGAQELATYLSRTDSLKKLIPAMNDMLAQQYGLNASQEQAINIGSMMGKVMNGQMGALSRYGYSFTDAQERILKFGNEQQRAATLADVITSSVGGVNKALAQTPEGAWKQHLNRMGDIQERVGKLYTSLKLVFMSVPAMVGNALNKIVGFFERNKQKIIISIQFIAKVFTTTFKAIGWIIKSAVNVFNRFVDGIQKGNPVFVVLGAILAGIVGTLLVYKATMLIASVIIGIVILATKGWAAAQMLLNNALMANPLGFIIGVVIALAALIGYVIYKTDGWAKQWEALKSFFENTWSTIVSFFQLKWLQFQDAFLSGLELIQKGWYKLKGLWDKSGADEGLSHLAAERDARAKEILEQQRKLNAFSNAAAESLRWELSWNSERSLSGLVGGISKQLGINVPDLGADGGDGSDLKQGMNSIVTGGTRSTNVNITIGNVVGNMTLNKSDFSQNIDDMREQVLDALIRTINMSQSAAQ